MAKGPPVCVGDISAYSQVSRVGIIWTDISIEAFGGISPGKHCGFKKRGKDKSRYFNMAQSSLEESRYYLILANDLGYGDTTLLMDQLEEVSKLLVSYTSTILSTEF